MNIDKIEQEANWFMGDKDNQQHLAEYVPDLLAEVKRLKEREGTLLEMIDLIEAELNKYAKLYSEELE